MGFTFSSGLIDELRQAKDLQREATALDLQFGNEPERPAATQDFIRELTELNPPQQTFTPAPAQPAFLPTAPPPTQNLALDQLLQADVARSQLPSGLFPQPGQQIAEPSVSASLADLLRQVGRPRLTAQPQGVTPAGRPRIEPGPSPGPSTNPIGQFLGKAAEEVFNLDDAFIQTLSQLLSPAKDILVPRLPAPSVTGGFQEGPGPFNDFAATRAGFGQLGENIQESFDPNPLRFLRDFELAQAESFQERPLAEQLALGIPLGLPIPIGGVKPAIKAAQNLPDVFRAGARGLGEFETLLARGASPELGAFRLPGRGAKDFRPQVSEETQAALEGFIRGEDNLRIKGGIADQEIHRGRQEQKARGLGAFEAGRQTGGPAGEAIEAGARARAVEGGSLRQTVSELPLNPEQVDEVQQAIAEAMEAGALEFNKGTNLKGAVDEAVREGGGLPGQVADLGDLFGIRHQNLRRGEAAAPKPPKPRKPTEQTRARTAAQQAEEKQVRESAKRADRLRQQNLDTELAAARTAEAARLQGVRSEIAALEEEIRTAQGLGEGARTGFAKQELTDKLAKLKAAEEEKLTGLAKTTGFVEPEKVRNVHRANAERIDALLESAQARAERRASIPANAPRRSQEPAISELERAARERSSLASQRASEVRAERLRSQSLSAEVVSARTAEADRLTRIREEVDFLEGNVRDARQSGDVARIGLEEEALSARLETLRAEEAANVAEFSKKTGFVEPQQVRDKQLSTAEEADDVIRRAQGRADSQDLTAIRNHEEDAAKVLQREVSKETALAEKEVFEWGEQFPGADALRRTARDIAVAAGADAGHADAVANVIRTADGVSNKMLEVVGHDAGFVGSLRASVTGQVKDSWLVEALRERGIMQSVLTRHIPEDTARRIAQLRFEAALIDEYGRPYEVLRLQREVTPDEIATAGQKAFDDEIAKSNDLTRAEQKRLEAIDRRTVKQEGFEEELARLRNSDPEGLERAQEAIDFLGDLRKGDVTDDLGMIGEFIAKFRNFVFGPFDAAVWPIHIAASLGQQLPQISASIINRGMTAVGHPIVQKQVLNLGLERRVAAEVAGVTHGRGPSSLIDVVRPESSAKAGQTSVGTLTRYADGWIPGAERFNEHLDDFTDWWTEFQYGNQLGAVRDAAFEGDLIIKHILGKLTPGGVDIADPVIRRLSADRANAFTMAATFTQAGGRANFERNFLISRSATRAQFNQVLQLFSIGFSKRATPIDRILAATGVAMSTATVSGMAWLLHKLYGAAGSEVEMNPLKPGWGLVDVDAPGIGKRTLNVRPQRAVMNAIFRSFKALEEEDSLKVAEAWGGFWVGRSSIAGRTLAGAVDVGFDQGYKFGDLDTSASVLNLLPLPPVFQTLYEEGINPGALGMEFFGIGNFPTGATSELDNAFRERFGTGFFDMPAEDTLDDQGNIVKGRKTLLGENPDLQALSDRSLQESKERGSEMAANIIESNELTDRAVEAQQLSDDALAPNGEFTAGLNAAIEWKGDRSDRQDAVRTNRDLIFAGTEPGEPTTILQKYYAVIDAQAEGEFVQKIDDAGWEAIDAYVATLPQPEQDLIASKTGIGITEFDKKYRSEIGRVAEARYFKEGDPQFGQPLEGDERLDAIGFPAFAYQHWLQENGLMDFALSNKLGENEETVVLDTPDKWFETFFQNRIVLGDSPEDARQAARVQQTSYFAVLANVRRNFRLDPKNEELAAIIRFWDMGGMSEEERLLREGE